MAVDLINTNMARSIIYNDITEILLKVALNTITLTLSFTNKLLKIHMVVTIDT
jgi:hypothetical protein